MRRAGAVLAAFALAASALVAGIITAPAAEAAAPVEPATAFSAELCAGETNNAPSAAAVNISGPRLEAYNSGEIVPMYNSQGTMIADAAPPLCAVYYDSTTGSPVSTWMFCSNFELHTCGGTNGNNELVQQLTADESPTGVAGPVVIPFPTDIEPDHLDERQKNAIKALTSEGHVINHPFLGEKLIRADGTTADRASLQEMVWCVSEPNDYHCYAPFLTEEDIDALAARGVELTAQVAVNTDLATVPAGSTIRWDVTTNAIDVPMSVIADSEVTVCEDSADAATVVDGLLTVSGTVGESTTVSLCSTASDEGTYNFEINRDGVGARFVQSQNDGILDRDCQVFGLYEAEGFSAQMTVGVLADDETDGTDADGANNDTEAVDADGTDATEGTDAAEGTDGTDGTDATEGTDGTDGTDATDATEGTDADGANNDAEAVDADADAADASNATDGETGDETGLATTGSDLPVAALGIALIMLLGGAGLVLARKARTQS
ncbi:hypothetical protein [Microbacterium sp. GXF6406]